VWKVKKDHPHSNPLDIRFYHYYFWKSIRYNFIFEWKKYESGLGDFVVPKSCDFDQILYVWLIKHTSIVCLVPKSCSLFMLKTEDNSHLHLFQKFPRTHLFSSFRRLHTLSSDGFEPPHHLTLWHLYTTSHRFCKSLSSIKTTSPICLNQLIFLLRFCFPPLLLLLSLKLWFWSTQANLLFWSTERRGLTVVVVYW
jgi:hypothetical protein